MFFTIRAGCGYESLHDGLGLGQMEQDPSGAVEADSVIKVSTCYLAMLEVLKSRGIVDVWRGRGRRRGRSRCRRQRALWSQERRHLGTRRGPRFRVEGRVDGPIPRRRLDERAVVAPRRPPDDRIGLHARLRCLATARRAPPLHADDRVTFIVEGPLRDDLCGNQNFTARFALSSTPSMRRLLDGVAMPVPHRSTEPARQRHRREMT